MDQQTQTFVGHNGTLIVGQDGVRIVRNFKQALTSGHLLEREVAVPYSAMESVHHQHAGIRPGYLQFVTKTGAPGSNPMNRHHKIHFKTLHDHTFRQAKSLIDERLQQYAEQPPVSDNQGPPPPPSLPYQR